MAALRAVLDFPLGRHAPRGARTMLRPLLITWGFTDADWLDRAGVVVSELVTNSVLHGGGVVELRVELAQGMVTISSTDDSPVLPHKRQPDASGGHGLRIIEQYSAAWGVEPLATGKRVWVRLPSHPDGSDRP